MPCVGDVVTAFQSPLNQSVATSATGFSHLGPDLKEEVGTFGNDSRVAMVDRIQEFDFSVLQIKLVEHQLSQLG